MSSRGVNKVILVGNLGNDPEMRYMPNGDAVCNLSIATSESWKDKQGQQQEKTEWHRVTMFRKLGEIAGTYLTKGSQVYLEGKLQTRKWQDQQGNDKYSTEIIADQMQMLGGGNSSPSSQQPQRDNRGNPQQPNRNYDGTPKTPEQMKQQPAPPKMAEPEFNIDDEIPFAPIGLQYRAILHAM